MGRVYKSPCGRIELREGKWQDVLADVERVDAVITDPPYSERTHAGYRSGSSDWDAAGFKTLIDYEPMIEPDAVTLAGWAISIAHSWCCFFGDDVTQRWFQDYLRQQKGWLCFAPVCWLKRYTTPRLAGDGPTNSCEWLTVARQRRRNVANGALPGFYESRPVKGADRLGVVGGKNPIPMRALVRDYSRPNDLICDPCAGSGTTLLAAAIEGRRAIGAEMDPNTYELAVKRLKKGYTPTLF